MNIETEIEELVDTVYAREASGTHEENQDVDLARLSQFAETHPVHLFVALIKKAKRCGA